MLPCSNCDAQFMPLVINFGGNGKRTLKVGLFDWRFSSHWRIVHSYGDLTIHTLTIARHSWPLSSEGYLACHTTFFYSGHLRGPMALTPIAKRLTVELSLPVSTTYVCWGFDSNIQPSTCMRGERSNRLHLRGAKVVIFLHICILSPTKDWK